jgi:hypothetical protein
MGIKQGNNPARGIQQDSLPIRGSGANGCTITMDPWTIGKRAFIFPILLITVALGKRVFILPVV